MASRYQTREYREARAELTRKQQRGEWLTCVEPVCLMPTRDIAPSEPAHVCHDPTGTVILGPGHARCNTSEGATRGNQQRDGMTRWVL